MRTVLLGILLVLLYQSTMTQTSEWYIFDNNQHRFLSEEVWSIAVDKDNNIYFSTFGSGICKFDWINWRKFAVQNSQIPSNDIGQIFFDEQNKLWCASSNGIANYDGVKWMIYNSNNTTINDNYIYCVSLDSNDGFWFSNYYGLYHYNNKKVEVIDIQVSNLRGSAETILTDKEKNVWFGSGSYGLVKYDGEHWFEIGEDKYEPYAYIWWYYVRAMEMDYHGNVWLTPNMGLAKLEGDKFRLWDYERGGFPSNYVYCIKADRDDNIWVGTDSGLVKFDGERFTTFNRDNSPLPSNRIVALAIDSSGHKWISCYLPWLGETRIVAFREGGTVFTDVEEKPKDTDVKIYPNPAEDYLEISNIKEQINYEIFSIEGVLQLQGLTFGRVNVSNLPAGLYYIKITQQVFKFVKI